MATIIPALHQIDLSNVPSSEQKVLQVLDQLDFPGLEVYFSVNLVNPGKRGTYRSEADFILFHPQHGLLVWEVKGGGISLHNGQWFSQNAKGQYSIKDPVKQADNAIGVIIKRTNEKLGKDVLFPLGRNLVFPDTRAQTLTLPLGLVREDILDFQDLQNLTTASLTKQFARWPQQDNLPLSKETSQRLRQWVLNPTFNLLPCVNARIDAVETQLVQLTEQQFWALELLKFIPRLTITGGAGTGKTLLARQKTSDLVSAGKRVLTLCFNNGLAGYLKTSLADVQQSHPEKLTVGSFHEFARQCLENSPAGWQPPTELEQQRSFYEETVPQELENWASQQGAQFDALVVDEAQDFHPLWWMALEPLLTADAAVYLFADPEQNLYSRDFELPSDVFTGMVQQPFHLSQNCRNSFEIATWLSEEFPFASQPSERLPKSGYAVAQHQWQSAEQQNEQILQAWNNLADKGVDASQVAIISPYRPDKSSGIRGLQAALPNLNFTYSTINAFKGLQAPFVFLVDMNTGDFASRPDLWYVGCTRATLGLTTFARQ